MMRRNIDFVKYHGCGNDFLLVDETNRRKTPDKERSRLATILCDRHFSVGADGVIFIERARGSDGSMRLFEPAGNEADMCGNGLRCVGAHVMKRLGKKRVAILTRDGRKIVERKGDLYRVSMGPIRTSVEDIRRYVTRKGLPSGSTEDISVSFKGRRFEGWVVNSGEPHMVFKVPDLDALDVVGIGESVNSDTSRFPSGININFVQVMRGGKIRIRTYERGVYDETLACGTGATASAGVAVLAGWVRKQPVTVNVLGGCITIELEGESAYMTGPAEEVFQGKVTVEA